MPDLDYIRINGKNYSALSSSANTPLNADNLNVMDKGINDTVDYINNTVMPSISELYTIAASVPKKVEFTEDELTEDDVIVYAGSSHLKSSNIPSNCLARKDDDNHFTLQTFDEGIFVGSSQQYAVGQNNANDEFLYVQEDADILVSTIDDTDNTTLIGVTEGQLKLSNLAAPTNNTDATTKEYVDTVSSALATDYLDDIFEEGNEEAFQAPEIAHGYRLGRIMFVHLVFRPQASGSGTVVKTVCKIKHLLPQHSHSFPCAATNTNTGTITSDGALLKEDGTLELRLTGTTNSKNYLFDLNFFYCTDH